MCEYRSLALKEEVENPKGVSGLLDAQLENSILNVPRIGIPHEWSELAEEIDQNECLGPSTFIQLV